MMRRMKQDIDSSLHHLAVSQELAEKTIASAKGRRSTFSFPHSGFIAVGFTVMLSVGVLANSGMLERIKAVLGNTYETSILQPVTPKEVSTDCNIKMEVAAALSDSDAAVIYIVAQDLTGGRLSEDFRFCHLDFDPNAYGSVAWTYRVVKYEPETNSVYLKLSLDGEQLSGKELQFSAKSFFSSRFAEEPRPLFSAFGAFLTEPPSAIVLPEISYLQPDAVSLPLSEQYSVFFSNAGVIDGELHLQIKCIGGAPGQYFPDFQFQQGSRIFSTTGYTVEYFVQNESGMVTETNSHVYTEKDSVYYQEIIYSREDTTMLLSAVEDGLSLSASLQGYQTYLSGNWVLDFQLEQAKDVYHQTVNFSVQNCQVSSVSLSPMGLTLRGICPDTLSDEEVPVWITKKDGSQIKAEITGSTWISLLPDNSAPNTTIRYTFNEVLDVSTIESVTIGENLLLFP